jgi:dTDP-4-dehydrorhamnose 3,5-epimerase-like enzyme
MALSDCRIIGFPKVNDPRGNLTFIEGGNHLDWDIRRVYYIYDVPGGAARGGHAHRENEELLVAMSGSFDVVLNDGFVQQRFHLNRSHYGLYVPAMTWRNLENFSSGSVCMVLASHRYDEADYFRELGDFLDEVGGQAAPGVVTHAPVVAPEPLPLPRAA